MSAIIPAQAELADDPYKAEKGQFAELVYIALTTIESDGGQRVYDQTYRAWLAWCQAYNHSPLELQRAVAFLASQPTTKATRQRQLSALRKVAQIAYIANPTPENQRIHEGLKLVKAPKSDTTNERTRRALTPSEADKLLRQWDSDSLQDARNRALVAVLLLAGLRRSEAAALRWSDVDFDNGVLYIRHGKGNKARDVPLAGDFAIEALREWRKHQPDGYVWVFCPALKSGKCGKDKPINGNDVWRIWLATAESAGIESKPHDARRTLITEALATGTPVSTVQGIAGHARGDTTLRYAQTVDAREARKRLKLRYG